MPMFSPPAQQFPDLSPLLPFVQFALSCLGAYFVAFTLALVIWTFRDISARTRDLIAIALSTILVAVFNVPGLLVYLMLRPRETLSESYERSLEEEYLLQDIEDAEICRACKRRVQPDFLFCPHCRTRLRRECESCGQPVSLRWLACPYCGRPTPFAGQAAPPAAQPTTTGPLGTPARPPAEAQLRQPGG
jgi:double zinc ribbon protein